MLIDLQKLMVFNAFWTWCRMGVSGMVLFTHLSFVLSLLVSCGPPSCLDASGILSGLSNLAGPMQHFKCAVLDAWRNEVSANLCAQVVFHGGSLLDIVESQQVLNSSHVRERERSGTAS